MSCSQRAAAPMASHAHSALWRAASQSSLLQSLTPADVAELADLCEVRTFQRGEVLMRVGEPALWFGVVVDGSLQAAIPKSERVRSAGRRPSASRAVELQEWRLMAAGSVVGEMSLFSGLQRTAHVEAMVDGVLAVVAFADLESLCDEQLSSRVRKLLAECAMGRLADNQAAFSSHQYHQQR